jgi:hypothetical protein
MKPVLCVLKEEVPYNFKRKPIGQRLKKYLLIAATFDQP